MRDYIDYFAGVKFVEDIKKLYKLLAMRHHPDRCGSTATMQEVNRQYLIALQNANGQTSTNKETNKEHTYKYDEHIEQAVMEFVGKVMKSGILNHAGVEAYIIGTWVWIMGNTKPISKQLGKAGLGCTWHSKRIAWYYTPEERKSFYSKAGFNGLAAKYGASKLHAEEAKQL